LYAEKYYIKILSSIIYYINILHYFHGKLSYKSANLIVALL